MPDETELPAPHQEPMTVEGAGSNGHPAELQVEPLTPPGSPPSSKGRVYFARDGIFLGRDGLRAGWRILLFLIVLAAVAGVMYAIRKAIAPPSHHPRGGFDAVALIEQRAFEILALILTTLIFAKAERRRFADYGLPIGQAFRGRFWGGSLFGFASISLFIGIIGLSGHLILGSPLLHGGELLRYGLLWGAAFLCVGFHEEFLLRGYLFATLQRGLGFWPAAITTSLLFALMHISNPNEAAFGLTQVFIFGMVASLMLRRTGNLWLVIGYHSFWDWGQSYFYGVADSGIVVRGSLFHAILRGPALLTGGAVGPEGSLVVTGILIGTLAGFVAPRRETKAEPAVLLANGGITCPEETSNS